MEPISLPLHIPTAIGVTLLFVGAWLVYLFVRRRRSSPKPRNPSGAKRRYAKRRVDSPEPIAQ